jgi:hypothetical protein
MTRHLVVLGDRSAEVQSFQLLALALSEQAKRLANRTLEDPLTRSVPALLQAGARAVSLAICAGTDTPIEVLALAARNTFELWLRLIHIAATPENHQAWRDEALMDQLQVLDGIVGLTGDESAKAVIRDEAERVRRHGVDRGLDAGVKPKMAGTLAKAVGQEAEYGAFYKLYSKLVHPSSWAVNWPATSTSDMYRATLCANGQVYAWEILQTVERLWDVSALECYDAARAAMAIELSRVPARTLPNER